MQRSTTTRHRQSPDLNQTKVTPKTRPTHEAGHDGQLYRFDTEKKYVLAPKDAEHPMSYEYYQSIGYQLEEATPDGVRIRLGTTPVIGKPLEWRGNFLLSCSKERAEEIFLNGPTGLTGQNYYDKLMSKVKRNELEKTINVPGLIQDVEVSDLEQNPAHQVFR